MRTPDLSTDRTTDPDNPYGDNAGTRVGRPSRPERKNIEGNDDTALGGEAARGIEGANEDGDPDRPGSEPLRERQQEHEPGYGGKGGEPRPAPNP